MKRFLPGFLFCVLVIFTLGILSGDGQFTPEAQLPPLNIWAGPISGATIVGTAATANTIAIFGLANPRAVNFTSIFVYLDVVDASHNSDFGYYTGIPGGTCTLLAHIGATEFSSAAAAYTISGGGTATLPAGRIWSAYTSAASTIKPYVVQSVLTFASTTSTGTSSGGVLPGTMTCPSAGWGVGGLQYAFPVT